MITRHRPHVPEDVYPNIIEIMDHLAPPQSSRAGAKGNDASAVSAEFEFGLDLILDGLERLRPFSRARRR